MKNFKRVNSCKNIADEATADYNNDTNINDLKDIAPNKNTNVQIAAKKLSKNTNFSKERTLPKNPQKTDDDVVFFKQVPVYPRDRLARKTKDDFKFVKQVPLHPRERLRRKRKSITFDNYNNLSKKSKNENVTFMKQVPLDPRK